MQNWAVPTGAPSRSATTRVALLHQHVTTQPECQSIEHVVGEIPQLSILQTNIDVEKPEIRDQFLRETMGFPHLCRFTRR